MANSTYPSNPTSEAPKESFGVRFKRSWDKFTGGDRQVQAGQSPDHAFNYQPEGWAEISDNMLKRLHEVPAGTAIREPRKVIDYHGTPLTFGCIAVRDAHGKDHYAPYVDGGTHNDKYKKDQAHWQGRDGTSPGGITGTGHIDPRYGHVIGVQKAGDKVESFYGADGVKLSAPEGTGRGSFWIHFIARTDGTTTGCTGMPYAYKEEGKAIIHNVAGHEVITLPLNSGPVLARGINQENPVSRLEDARRIAEEFQRTHEHNPSRSVAAHSVPSNHEKTHRRGNGIET